jgi:hypothetical protein
VWIFDGVVPPGELPARALFIQPAGELEGLPFRNLVSSVGRVEWDPGEPVMRGVDLSDLAPEGILGYEESTAFRVVAEADGTPLILIGGEAGRRWAVLSFDPARTPFVYGSSYPILVANLVRWAAALSGTRRTWYRAGQDVALPGNALGGMVYLPGGGKTRPGGESGLPIVPADRAGRYRVSAANGDQLGEFFVNVLDERVTAGIAADGYGLGLATLPEGLGGGPYRVDFAPWLAVLALVCLAVERVLSRRVATGIGGR